MAHYILHKEMDAIQWDGDNYDSIEKLFGTDWILGTTPYDYDHADYTGRDKGKNYIRLKLAESPNHTLLVPLGQYIARYVGSDEVFELKEKFFNQENWVKDYKYDN